MKIMLIENRRPHCFSCFFASLMLVFLVTTASAEPTTVTFDKRSSVVGDGLDQTILLETIINTRKRQDQKIIEEVQRRTGRQQRRQVTVGAIEAGRVVGVEVSFLESKESLGEVEVSDPVVGKAYKCVRKNNELQVFTLDGKIPAINEYKVVAQAMESLGKPNPLADYLVGRQLSLGQELTLPSEVAQQVFGLDKRLGMVDKFDLKLTTIETVEGRLTATFDAEVEAIGTGSTQMRLLLNGPLIVECATSRVVMTELTGPIGMLESRGSLGNTYHIDGTGRLQLKISSRFRDLNKH